MSVLAVPEAGLQLESSAGSSDFLPTQAFGITLNDAVIEDMIKCVQNGQNIELSFGKNPTFQYGNQEHHIKPAPDAFDYDLYLTNPYNPSAKTHKLPNPTMSILTKPPVWPKSSMPPGVRVEKVKTGKPIARAGSSSPEPEARDKLQKTAKSTKFTNGTPSDAKRGIKATKSKLLPPGKKAMASVLNSSGTPRSLPTSPAPSGVGSPSLNPAITASQQVYEKNKDQRSTFVHELAVRDRTEEYLTKKWNGSGADLKSTLRKVADEVDGKWSMKKLYWKELDVWNYDYDTQEDRQAVIDSAIKIYDRRRLPTSAPEWERLLKKDDRGKGIVLSKLQATLAKGNITPVPRIKADDKVDEGSKNDSDESSRRKGGEAMSRSSSQTAKAKKGSDREAQTKRMLSNNPKKPAPPVKKAAAPAAVSKAKKEEEKARRVLSEEFVHSSSSEDEAPLSLSQSQTNLKPKPAEKLAERSLEKRLKDDTREIPAPAVKPKLKSVVRAPKAPLTKAPTTATATATTQKRARDDDDSSSSSGSTPLSKRVKTKEAPKLSANSHSTSHAQSNGVKHRPSDASQNSRSTTSSTISYKSKNNTSPAKSSPLASSPPTNASDIEDNSQSHNHRQSYSDSHHRTNGLMNGNGASMKKRKERDPTTLPPTKKQRVSREILEKALKFDAYYKRYETLHHDLIQVQHPPQNQLDLLLEMRERLVELKAEITRQVASTS